MRISANYLIFLCLGILVSTGFAQPINKKPDYTPLIQKYRKLFTEEMKKYNDAGVSVALVDGDSTVWCEGFGFYNKQARTPVTGHTPFHIGSICKTFTGLAVMQLQEDGKLCIDSSYKKYVPQFSMRSLYTPAEAITIRNILTHHAGIPDFVKDKFAAKPPYFSHVLDIVNRDYATFPPNTIFSYSNAGFSILGNLIESTSGGSYFDFIKSRILDPLEMNETGFAVDTNVPESVRLGYDTKGEEHTEMAVFDAPAGCIYSSANDMAHYIKAHLKWGTYHGRHVFDSTTLVQMMKVQNDSVFLDLGGPYGLAWRTYINSAGRSIQHDGGTLYHRAELSISPECGLGVVMLSNSASGKPLLHVDYDIFNDALAVKGMAPIRVPQTGPKNIRHPERNFSLDQPRPAPVQFTVPDSRVLRRLAGIYGTFGMYYTVTADSNALAVSIMGQHFYLLPIAKDDFISAAKNDRAAIDRTTRFYFEVVNGNPVMIQIDKWGTHHLMGEKITPQPLSTRWRHRFGAYRTDGVNPYQLFSNFRMASQDGLLVMRANFNMEMGTTMGQEVTIPLKIINDSLAVVWGYGRFSGQAVQFASAGGGGEVMRFLGFTCTK
jgi:CubicO group peptidase (beta-lactamase class C family)